MAHQFASGASKPQRTLIQQGAIALLAGLKRPTGYLVDVIPWGAVVRSFTDDEGVAMLVDAIGGRAPAVAIATGDRTPEGQTVGGFQVSSYVDLLVYFASSNAWNQQLGRQEMDAAATASNTADPGLHVMMEHASELLVGQRCGSSTAVKQVRWMREEELATTPSVTIWLQTYRVLTLTMLDEFRTATQLLESIGITLTPHSPPVDDMTLEHDIDLT